MLRCPSCATELPAPGRFCPFCGAAVIPSSEAATVAIPRRPPSSSSSSSIDEGRFPAGTLLADRYRILSLLGRGGMGEVYRANDLKLSQPVAIKFLPEETAANERMLARFHAEVRIARQVSHPNVCRVYDIGEYQGSTYITMEYVDGEDLASLLRRIGRLPGDKAIEIARKLCAGLAAAHDKGVLHRDLKPANIMIDGRGQVLISDFGLAGLAGQVEGGEIRNGTPAYMAPEQLAGKEVSVRSDIYALGLVLYEMFTGKRAFEDGAQRTTPAGVSTLVKDIDPAVERVILRCLEEDPRARPHSALAVAAALPGGDPLAAALAAGETPSPEMVAAAGETDGISIRTAVLCLAAIVAGLILTVVLGSRVDVSQRIPLEKSPEVLAQKARELIEGFGYTGRPTDSALGLGSDVDYQRYAEQRKKPDEFRAQLAKSQPPLIDFWYRQSPRYLETFNANGRVAENDPPPLISGMAQLELDTLGRLIYFAGAPPQVEETPASSSAPDVKPLFAAAGLDPARFTSTGPKWTPLATSDARAAWTGFYPDAPGVPLRVEAAWWRGKPVYFQMIGLWTRPERVQPFQETTGRTIESWVILSLICTVFAVAALLAWRNFRLGRGDTRGASRLAVFMLCLSLLAWLFAAKHVPTLWEYLTITWAISAALFVAALYWVLYMALEPYVRRRWPQSLISWSRLLAGGFRDPLVGGQVLIGMAVGVALNIDIVLGMFLRNRVGDLQPENYLYRLRNVLDMRHLAGGFILNLQQSIQIPLFLFFLFFLLRVILRRQWLAALVWILLWEGLVLLSSTHPLIDMLMFTPILALILFILMRFGLLPLIAFFFASDLTDTPITTDWSAWYAGGTILNLVTILALAAYAFHIARAGRPLFKEGFLE